MSGQHGTGITRPAYRVGERVQVRHNGRPRSARISAIHRHGDAVEYVVWVEPDDGGTSQIVNIRVDGTTGWRHGRDGGRR